MLNSLKKQMLGLQSQGELWDMYTHLLPEVDDGALSKEEGGDIVVKLKGLGFDGAYCTPHISKNYPHNTRPFLEERFAEFTNYLSERQECGNFELRLAALYMLDDSFMETLEKGDLFTIDGKRILVECHQLLLNKNWRKMLDELKQRGYIPVLTHPEKYINTFTCEQLSALHDEGIELQLCLFSLLDIYGKDVKKRALWLLKHAKYSSFGTGCHRNSQLKNLNLTELSNLLTRKDG